MESKTFKFSESVIMERRKNISIMQILMPIFIIAFVLVREDFQALDIGRDLFVLFFTIIITETILILQPRMMFKRLKESELIVSDIGIERKNLNYVESIAFKDINKVLLREKKSGEVMFIDIRTPTTKIKINGYEDMDEILNNIKQNIPNQVIELKQNKIDLDIRMVTICSAIITLVILLGLIKFQYNFYHLYNDLFSMAIGSVFLIYRPISKNSGTRFKKKETILGMLLLTFGLISFLLKLFQ